MQDLAIYIDSFDGNADAWPTFFKVYQKFWNDCQYPGYLVTNNLDYEADNLTVIKTGDEKNWFVMTIKGLEQVKEKYVYFVLEDQLIGQKMNNEDIEEIVSGMEKEDIFFYRMTCPRSYPQKQSFVKVTEDARYPISLQPAIWRRETFLQFLKDLYANGCKSPWDFERHFIEKYKNGDPNKYIDGIRYDSRNLMNYKNILIQGKWDPRVVKYYKQNGIVVDTGSRPFMPRKAVFLDGIKRNKLIRSLSNKNQSKLKKLLKKLGIDFMT